MTFTSSHALLQVLATAGVDRLFLVPGESYLGLLDALLDFPQFDVVTCRHEGGAGFMALADARLTGRPGVVMVSRGPGATNASIALHAAQQDAVPLLLIVGQVPVRQRHRDAFQEIDYGAAFGSIAKWVHEVHSPEQMAEAACRAMRTAISGTPGPVVLVIPEDLQQQAVEALHWDWQRPHRCRPSPTVMEELLSLLTHAERPLVIAGGAFDVPGGRTALQRFAEEWHVPVAVSFRRQDLFDNAHPLYGGELGLLSSNEQIDLFRSSDVVLALGTRLGDVTTQGYRFPAAPVPKQTLVHCHSDPHVVGRHAVPRYGLVCDVLELATALASPQHSVRPAGRDAWARRVHAHARSTPLDGATGLDEPARHVLPADVAGALGRYLPGNSVICMDAGAFAAAIYRDYQFRQPQRLLASQSGAMGVSVPAAIAAQLRLPHSKVACLVGDGSFMMTGNEMIVAVERQLPILFVVSNNGSYESIRLRQVRDFPGRPSGVHLFNPDFAALARSFGMSGCRVAEAEALNAVIADAMTAPGPTLVELMTAPTSNRPTARARAVAA
jgi:acetolactate synthase-1/2/3 large subunit